MSKSTKSAPVSKSGTRFGVKSAPEGTPGHFFKWTDPKTGAPSGEAGVGVGTCIHCGVKQEYRRSGPRNGFKRFYRVVGSRTWTETEPKCSRKAATKKTDKAA